MAIHKDAYGNWVDSYTGHTFQTRAGDAPTGGSPITIHNGDGTTSHGTFNGQASKN